MPQKKKPSLHTHLFPLSRCLLKLLTVYSCFPPLRKTHADLRPHHEIISEPHTVDPEGYVEVHSVMLLLKMVKVYDDGASSSSVPSAREMIRTAPAEC